MAQRNRRKSKKNSQLTYEDIKTMSPEQLEQMGLGSWLKDNVGNIAQTVGGGLMIAAGAGLTGITAGLGTPIGASLVAGGVGMMGSGASGFANTAAQNDAEALQKQQTLQANKLGEANTDLQNKMNENPLVSYGVTMRRGGKLPKYQTGGPTDPIGKENIDIPSIITMDQLITSREETPGSTQSRDAVDMIKNIPSRMNVGQFDKEINIYRYTPEGAVNETITVPYDKYDSWLSENAPLLQGTRYQNLIPTTNAPVPSAPQQMAMGGTINYGGQLHEGPNGGVPVDAQGNPNAQNPVALVEKGEVKYSTGEGDYIFSDQLELRKGKTFARRAKDVQSKYKMRMKDGIIADPIAKKGYDKEMGDLVKKQEELRSIVAPQEQPMMRTGGDLPKMQGDEFTQWLNDLQPNTATYTPKDMRTTEVLPEENLYQGQTWGETGLQMIPGIASGISNILIAGSRKRAMENMPSLRAPEVVPQQINLEAARAGVREQGNVARANTRRGLRGAASTAGQYMGNVGATETGVQRGVSEGLNQLNIQEETTNAGLRSSAEALNAQMKARTQEINSIKEQQMMDAYYNQLAGGIGQIGQGITGALSTKAQSNQMANMLQMMQPNYKLTIDGNPTWGIGNKVRRTPVNKGQ